MRGNMARRGLAWRGPGRRVQPKTKKTKPSPLPMFEADSQNFASVPLAPRRFKLKNFWPTFGGDHRGTLEGGGSQPNPLPLTPSDPPPPPLLIHPCQTPPPSLLM